MLGFNLAEVRALLDGRKQLLTQSSGQHPSRELLANMASAAAVFAPWEKDFTVVQWDQCGAEQAAREQDGGKNQ
jgi:hypothetical protein